MTFGQLIKDTRLMLVDKGAVEELTDSDYAQFATAGMKLMWELCPQCRLADTGRTVNTWAKADPGEPDVQLCVNTTYYHPLLDYVMFRYYDRDSGDSRDKKQARYYWDQFARTLDLVGGK